MIERIKAWIYIQRIRGKCAFCVPWCKYILICKQNIECEREVNENESEIC